MVRGMGWGGLVVVALVPATAASARAAAPACFPERTVLWAAHLSDDEGRVFGGVRAGQVVHVVEDRVGDDDDEALVEVRTPVVVRGRLPRDRLLVFARREIPVEKDWSWWLAEAPLWALDGDGKHARVNRAEPHGSRSGLPDVTVACAELRGTSPRIHYQDACVGARHASPSRSSGVPVHWEGPVEMTGPGGPQLMSEPAVFHLIRREGARVLVDRIEYWKWLRVRGWADGAGMRRGRPGLGGRGHGCCEGALMGEATGAPLTLRRREALRVSGPGARSVWLTARTRIHEVARLQDELFVRYEGHSPGRAWTTVELMGWIPISAVAGRVRLPPGRTGRVVFPAGKSAADASEIVIATLGRRSTSLRGRVGEDLSFVVPAFVGEGNAVIGWTTDRRWSGKAEPQEGTGLTPTLEFQPMDLIAGRVTTVDGLAIPCAEVANLGVIAGLSDRTAITDARGRFQLTSWTGDRLSLWISAAGFETVNVWRTEEEGLMVTLPRRRIVAGVVGRGPTGACVEDHVSVEAEESVAVPPEDCSFAVVWDSRDPLMLGGGKNGGPQISLTSAGRKSAWCDPQPAEFFEKLPKMFGEAAPKTEKRCDVTGDVNDICLGGPCPAPTRGSFFVRVATRDGALVPDVDVTIRANDRVVGSCKAQSGACFVHGLPVGSRVSVEARSADGRTVEAPPQEPRVGVVEVTLRLP